MFDEGRGQGMEKERKLHTVPVDCLFDLVSHDGGMIRISWNSTYLPLTIYRS